ncbi:UDP-3-O-(3-hydroxymyristoyl)glucosamine N-acyltransferase [Neptunomonas japonica]|uniref:UDP-3-O-(3-hydroxymyristoyl)glucosamine N-acyltransferase n=1 Tax=Neptunomonas japonica TaxID=417574 RepID=UPI00041480EB|nr:UDP-3-O-(3-hydroxymyristoyl)glucosamine N-acyltransferase [Neptunomonas japonica]
MIRTLPSFTLSEIASLVKGRLVGDSELVINSLSTLESAKSGQLSFLANAKYTASLGQTQAGAVLITENHLVNAPCAAVVVDDPYLAFAQLSKFFDWRLKANFGIASSAHISASAQVHEQASIAAGVVLGEETIIESGVYIGPNAVVGNRCVVAKDARIEAGVILYDDVHIGQRSLVHSGAVLGGDGFGFAPTKGAWVKIYQLGGVRVGQDVEIGAGTTVDRGALDHTYIKDGVKLDNQIQIAHNVVIGEQTAIAGCTAIAGSTKIGRRCTIAGMSGIVGHLTIADNTHITAMSLISKSVTQPGQVLSSGTGQELHRSWKKNVIRFKKLDSMAKRITALENKVDNFSSEG